MPPAPALFPGRSTSFPLLERAPLLAHHLNKAGEQWRGLTRVARQKRINQVAGDSLLQLLARDARRIKKGPAFLAAIQYSFFVQAVERGHERGVGPALLQLLEQVAYRKLLLLPHRFHGAPLQLAER